MNNNTSNLLDNIVKTSRRGKYKGISFVTTEHFAKVDGAWEQSSVTFRIDIELKYISKKYRSFWLNKEKKHGLLDYPHRDLECFFSGSDDIYSFKTELGYELTGYYKLSGFEEGDDKIVELKFSSDTCCWSMTQSLKQVKQAINAFLSNVPEYTERMQSNESVT